VDNSISSDIVLTGIGLVSPFGLGVEPFEKGLENGDSAIKEVTRFELQEWCSASLSATVPDFPLHGQNFLLEELTGNTKESMRASPQIRLAWISAHIALDDAGIVLDDTLCQRAGIFVGLSRFGMDPLEFILERSSSGRLAEIMPLRPEWIHPHGVAAHLSYLYQIVGPCLTFSASCQSGIQALETAMLYLATDHIDVALVLSTDTISRFQFHVEAAAGILSPERDPNMAPRPYDQNADGIVLSEGGIALILERINDAYSRSARIRAKIVALETSVEPARFPPLADEQQEMDLTQLLNHVNPKELDLIHADGRGIPGLDRAESKGIRKVFGKFADDIPVTSIQGSMGHAGGTSALFQVVSTALIFESSLIPPIRNLENPAEGCDLDYVTGKSRRARVNQAVVLSHGWGGHHSALVLKKR
jgi:3-oxoacyl-[acyl-carrier-protein] synthase II